MQVKGSWTVQARRGSGEVGGSGNGSRSDSGLPRRAGKPDNPISRVFWKQYVQYKTYPSCMQHA